MSFIEWQDQLATHIFVVDQEHRFLIKTLNKLHEVVNESQLSQQARDTLVMEVLNDLTFYTQTHFVVEEELMRVYAYPGLVNHKAEHDSFVAKVGYLTGEIKSHPMDISNHLLGFLKDWLTKHIMVIDSNMGKFLTEKGQN